MADEKCLAKGKDGAKKMKKQTGRVRERGTQKAFSLIRFAFVKGDAIRKKSQQSEEKLREELRARKEKQNS